MVLINNGKCDFVIAWQKNNQTAEFAASELKKYIEKSVSSVVEMNSADKSGHGKTFYIGINKYVQS